jgi:hypothetical protein
MNTGRNAAGEILHWDNFGEEYVLDEAGNRRVPILTSKKYTSSGFTSYDTSQGHCGLCGSLTCNGRCFK